MAERVGGLNLSHIQRFYNNNIELARKEINRILNENPGITKDELFRIISTGTGENTHASGKPEGAKKEKGKSHARKKFRYRSNRKF